MRAAAALLPRLREAGGGGWRTMESAPRDGTRILASTPVYSAQFGKFMHHDVHVIAYDPDGGEIDIDFEQGWAWEDYEVWQPVPLPPSPEGE